MGRKYRRSARGKQKSREWYAANEGRPRKKRPYNPSYEKTYQMTHPQKAREKWYKRKYGISIAQFDELLVKQGGGCAICKNTTPIGKKQMQWNLDHDHETDKIRGILCGVCNRTLGIAQENIFRLQKCIAYLRFHKKLIHWDEGTLWGGVPQGGFIGEFKKSLEPILQETP